MTSANQNFSFCPECGKQTVSYPRSRHWTCSSCGFDLYNNVAAAVGVIITDNEGRALFIKRAKEPRKGFLALPGGFVDPGESAEAAAVRECKEETGLDLQNIVYAASFPNIYVYKTVSYTTCDIFFTADCPNGWEKKLRAVDGEAESFSFCAAATESDIDKIPLAFPSAAFALKARLRNVRATTL